MTDLRFRSAKRQDVVAIVTMLADDPLGSSRESPDEPGRYLEAFREIDANPYQVLVVGELDGEIVATAQVSFMPGLSHRGMRRAEIEAVRVRTDRQGRGIGMKLMSYCIDLARERDCGLVQLTSNVVRTDARRFYERLGFTATHVGFKLKLSDDPH